MIKFEHLSVCYSKYYALEDINLEISDNSFIAILGPNGGGKTTFLKIILGLIKPSAGKVLIKGKKTSELNKNIIGYVPQIKTLDRSFPALSIELVVSGIRGNWPAKISKLEKEQAIEALKQVGAEHLAFRSLNKLSGGELQRIFFARSFVRNPEILLLDEPATGIDVVGESDIYNIIGDYEAKTDTTIIMVTHDWEAAYHHANKVLLLNRSQICFNEPDIAFKEENLRKAFSHIGHSHAMVFGVKNHD